MNSDKIPTGLRRRKLFGDRISGFHSTPGENTPMLENAHRAARLLMARLGGKVAIARHDVAVYTRSECHLCDDALVMLRKYGLQPRIQEIDSDPTLLAKYDSCVPVVVIDGKVRFRGRIEERLLKRLLRAPTPAGGEVSA